jgi:hypothetical protein
LRHRTLKLGLIAATAVSAMLPLLATQSAYADYAPSKGDVVGVGSDTLQDMMDFLADGDAYGDTGYNQIGNANKLVSFDATPDFNARLAYGVDGGQASQTTCTPGTGSTVGTANATGTNTGVPCVLNPTIVLRAGTQAVQRPNGSGAGFSALVQDIIAGNNGGSKEVINFSRASATQTTTASLPAQGTTPGSYQGIDQLSLATDTLPMLTDSTTNAVALSAAQLDAIYTANTGSCLTWNNPQIGGSSTDTIIPIIPQVGSGTRKTFLQDIGDTALTVGTCTVVGEENDPTAIAQQTSPADAIEPISQGRLDLFLGESNTFAPEGIGGYFLDPSCAYLSGSSSCGTGTVSAGTFITNSVNPPVKTLTGTPGGSLGGALFDPSRTLYIYFRTQDGCASYTATTGTHCLTWTGGPYTEHPFQSGSTQDWVHALFWNNNEAPAPYITGSEGQLLLEDAGVTPITPVCTVVYPTADAGNNCPY